MKFSSILALLFFFFLWYKQVLAQQPDLTPEYFLDSLQSEGQYVLENVDKFATPEYYQRKEVLRSFQRRGYAEILSRVYQQDGLSALLAYIKVKLNIELSLNHAPVYFRTPMKLVPLPLDWRFPPDPWKRE